MSLRTALLQKLKALEKPFQTLNRVEIDQAAILHNFDFLKEQSGAELFPVLKANAYGHGLKQIASILSVRSFPYLAVDSYFEAQGIREVSQQPILIMGTVMPVNFTEISYKNTAFVVHDVATIEALAAVKKKIRIHLELETGMKRHGVSHTELAHILSVLHKHPKLELEGVMSHLADADNADLTFTNHQTQRFDAAIDQILEAGFSPRYFHLAQTAGSLKVQSKYANAIRPGIGLYGINPLEENDPFYGTLENLKPALTVVSTLTKIQTLEPGDSVSYSRTYVAKEEMHIGILPIGYYEGLPRQLSNKGTVLWQNDELPIVGTINMNHCMVSLADTAAKVGDEVIVLGGKSENGPTIKNLVADYSLFPYTLLTGVNENLRRIIT